MGPFLMERPFVSRGFFIALLSFKMEIVMSKGLGWISLYAMIFGITCFVALCVYKFFIAVFTL